MKETLSNKEKWKFLSFSFSNYFKPKLEKLELEKIYQGLGEQLLLVLRQKLWLWLNINIKSDD